MGATERAMTMGLVHVPGSTKVNNPAFSSYYSNTVDDTEKIYQMSSRSCLLNRLIRWHHVRLAFRGQCESSNRVLAIATTCVKNSSYPSMLRRHSKVGPNPLEALRLREGTEGLGSMYFIPPKMHEYRTCKNSRVAPR